MTLAGAAGLIEILAETGTAAAPATTIAVLAADQCSSHNSDKIPGASNKPA